MRRDVCYANSEQEKMIFVFFFLFFFLPSLPLSGFSPACRGKIWKGGKPWEMKGAENKGTTIVDGTKTNALKFRRHMLQSVTRNETFVIVKNLWQFSSAIKNVADPQAIF